MPTKKSEEFKDRFINDNINRASLMGHLPDEYDNGLAMDYHEYEYISPPGHVFSDEELEAVVKELLENSKRVNSDDITVTAHNCDITLSGTVKSEEEKNMAGPLVQLIHGVGIVKNELVVKLNEGILPSDIGRDA